MMLFVKRYLYNVLVVIDELVNVVILFGDPQETISGRCGRILKSSSQPRKCYTCFWLCVVLNKVDNDHCREAIEAMQGDDDLITPPKDNREK